MNDKGLPITEVVGYIAKMTKEGMFGSLELVFRGHDIIEINHSQKLRAGELPK